MSSWGSSYWKVHIITQLDGTVLRKMLSTEEGSKAASWRKGHLIPSLKDKSSRNQEWGGSRKEEKRHPGRVDSMCLEERELLRNS